MNFVFTYALEIYDWFENEAYRYNRLGRIDRNMHRLETKGLDLQKNKWVFAVTSLLKKKKEKLCLHLR
jgi:hypothetical protein